jgi:hypothetical protein
MKDSKARGDDLMYDEGESGGLQTVYPADLKRADEISLRANEGRWLYSAVYTQCVVLIKYRRHSWKYQQSNRGPSPAEIAQLSHRHPVAALQRFGLVRTPAPPWVALHRVIIPQSTLVPAAEYLVEALGGAEMAYKVAGGSKWWQVRAGPGVEAEWIVMKKDWKEYTKAQEEKKRSQVDLKDTAEEHDGVRFKAREESSGDGLVGEDGGVGENGSCGFGFRSG